MTPTLAVAFDELGLGTLIQGFLSRVHHHPDPAALARYGDPRLIGAPHLLYPDPGPAQLLGREGVPDPAGREVTRLRYRAGAYPAATAWHFRAAPLPAGRPARHTVLILHGGLVGTEPRGHDLTPYLRWCDAAMGLGLDALFVELPYHLSRTPRGRFSGELMVSGDLIRTMDAVRQAVAEIRALVGWLAEAGLPPAGLLGMSLGGFVGAQVVAVEPRLRFAALLAPVPEPARTFSDTLIGRALFPDWAAPGLGRAELDHLFGAVRPVGLRPVISPADLLLVAARHDLTVELSDMERLAGAWDTPLATFDVGHMGLPLAPEVTRRGLLPFLGRYG